MGMVGIGEMPVAVAEPRMPMGMAVGLSRRILRRMIMAVMDVMAMTVGVAERPVHMLMSMALRQM